MREFILSTICSTTTIICSISGCDPKADEITSATESSSGSSGTEGDQPALVSCDPEDETPECPADRPRCVSSTQGGTLYTACAASCNEDRTCSSRDDICVDLGEQLKVCLPNCTEDSLCEPGLTCVRPTLIDLDIAQVCFPNPTP